MVRVARMADAYHVAYKRVPTKDGDYTMEHSATVALFDKSGSSFGEEDVCALRDFCSAVERLDHWLESRAREIPALAELRGALPKLSAVRERIDRVVDGRGTVRSLVRSCSMRSSTSFAV